MKDQTKLKNLNKLEEMPQLENNWNENGAKAFSNNLITKTKQLINALDIQPEIFPTACESIQFKYDKIDGAYLEIEVNESDNAEVFIIDANEHESNTSIDISIELINKIINDFYNIFDKTPNL